MLTMTRKKNIGLGTLLALAVLILALALPRLAASRSRLDIITAQNAIGMVCTEDDGLIGEGTTTPTFDLQATAGYISTPDGNSIYMWGYALDGEPFQIPGPVLCVKEGDIVTINLTNSLPVPTSIIFPGQLGVSASGDSTGLLTEEATTSVGTASYTFEATHPGTFLYESGTEPHLQINMGLFGALVVRPLLDDPEHTYAYNDADTEFDGEFLLLLHEIDPELHQAMEREETYDVTTRHDRYWTINGRANPDALLPNGIPWMPAQPYGAVVYVQADAALPALVRYANAGTVNHPFHPHGDELMVVGRDGRFLGEAVFENFTTTIGAGQTVDLLFDWENVENWEVGPDASSGTLGEYVALPGINDLVYKDGVTFYSGDADLGQKGDLPVGVTSYNQCGEFYFPWHSHALNEIVNFNEGFGGMLTVVRVDPPNGCQP